jgi:hypothetical protein
MAPNLWSPAVFLAPCARRVKKPSRQLCLGDEEQWFEEIPARRGFLVFSDQLEKRSAFRALGLFESAMGSVDVGIGST